jgi:prophage antirepressor-like protein
MNNKAIVLDGQADLSLLKNPFEFLEIPIRTALDEGGDPWFCALDLCSAMGISWTGSGITLKSIPEKWHSPISFMTPAGRRDIVFVNLAGALKLIIRSNKPETDEFTNWVCGTVLPVIFKTGSFGSPRMSIGGRIALSKQIASVHIVPSPEVEG